MDHREYIRVVEGSRMAVLMVHGIAGTPAHFRELIPVIPQDWSVYNILLDGHGKGAEDFGATSMKKWKAQTAAVLQDIFCHHEQVIFVAHSMGTLFAIRAAVDHPDRIAGLFLLAVPSRPWVRFSTMLTCLRVVWGNIRPGDTAAAAMRNATGIQIDRKLWKYLAWIPRFLELLAEIRRIRKILPRLAVPSRSFQSRVDELVSVRSCKDLEGHPYICNTVLEDSGHFSYGENDRKLLQAQLREMIVQMQEKEA